VGLLATEGTVASRAYENALKEVGIDCAIPKEKDQKTVSDIIYGQVKKGLSPDIDSFLEVVDSLRCEGCERMILGCTELSLLKRNHLPGNDFIDSLEVLALSAIRLCGKEPKNFDAELMSFSVPHNNTFDHRIMKGNKPCC
jgi:aspartate racemase